MPRASDRDRGCRLQQHGKAQQHAAIQVEGEGHRRPANDGAVALAHEPNVAGRAVDLHPPPGHLGTGVGAGEQAQRTSRLLALAAPGQPRLVAGAHPGLYGGVGRRCQARRDATPVDVAHETEQARPARLGVVLLDRVLDDGLDRGRQAPCAGSWTAWQERPHVGSGRLRLAQELPHPALPDAQLGSDPIHFGHRPVRVGGKLLKCVAPLARHSPIGLAVAQLVQQVPRRGLIWKGDAHRIGRDHLAIVAPQQHGIGAERPFKAPTPAGVFHHGSGDETLLHSPPALAAEATLTLPPVRQERLRAGLVSLPTAPSQLSVPGRAQPRG